MCCSTAPSTDRIRKKCVREKKRWKETGETKRVRRNKKVREGGKKEKQRKEKEGRE